MARILPRAVPNAVPIDAGREKLKNALPKGRDELIIFEPHPGPNLCE